MTIPSDDYFFAGGAWPGNCEHCESWVLERAKYRKQTDPTFVVRICKHCADSMPR
jgi:hypothetical protein